jgi:hypothetical protein
MSSRVLYNICRIVLLLVLFTAVRVEAADCPEEIYSAVGDQFGLEAFEPREVQGHIVAEACKIWPASPSLLLGAFAYDSGIEYEKDFLVVVFDRQSGRLVSSYRSRIDEDAITEAGEGSLAIDTARYELSKGVRAFGVRFHSTARGPSCADASYWDELTLFIQEKTKLRSVFKHDMQYQRALQGCIGSATGHDVWEYGVLTLSVMNTKTNGFYNLRLVDTVTVETNMDNPPANIDFKKRQSAGILRYDGIEYK